MKAAPRPFEKPGRPRPALLPWLVLLAFVAVSMAVKVWVPSTAPEVGRTRAWPALPWPMAGFVWAMPRLLPVVLPDASLGADAAPAAPRRWFTPGRALRLPPVLADVARAVMKSRR